MAGKTEEYIKDSIKMFFDLFKHLTTLDTGVIVILATFYSKSFDITSKNWLVLLCVITVLASLIISVIGMLAVAVSMGIIGHPKTSEKEINYSATITRWAFMLSILFFIAGVLSLVLFVQANIKA